MGLHELDDKDREIITRRMAALDARPGPRVGDWAEFADGVTRRVSCIWAWDDGTGSVQASDDGSWYLGDGEMTFSGSLYAPVPLASLEETGEARDGSLWISHHGWAADRDCGVADQRAFRVFRCPLPAPEA